MLSERQELILRLVVDAYLASAKPVGSRELADRHEVEWGPSTVRAELAALENAGYLTHPHTSAGRTPTDAGYRRYVDLLLESDAPSPETRVELELSRLRREVDEAMRETTAALAQVTDLVAMATAPPPSVAATIHRVEVMQLATNRIVVIGIASTGDVARRVFEFDHPVDPGLVKWASSYLNESLAGLGVGARMIAGRLSDPELGGLEADFVATLGSAFTELEPASGADLYVDGASRLLSQAHIADLPRADELMTALERRADVLQMLRSSLDQRSVFLWIGEENPQPELRSVSVIGANYGLAHRNLGTVGVVGPLRMDYATAISSVRVAARELSRYFETVYDG
ncbi:MAG TPA: heat-inducible transcriptional repressor HrcA [Solirubrobacterales bacterium]|jgi:heat-inducible transcriptional repressor|nr:heat-inducible transcriptional repressor HrcA [Solirubrobacterales bacterium]